MSRGTDTRVVGDLSKLPAAAFRNHSLWFWANLAFMLMEGVAFALGGSAYLYVMNGADQWPLDSDPPRLLWGTALTLLLLASLVPGAFLSHAARTRDAARTKFWAVVLTALNGLALVLRGFEFPNLMTRWDQDAYGSVTWMLMLLHTTHLVTDFLSTFFLTVFLFTHEIDTERFSDVDDDVYYWTYVVLTWLPLYALIYWAPRWVP